MANREGGTPDIAIEQGGIYEHETQGRVEVLGIWKGIRNVDEAQNIRDGDGLIVVCYTTEDDGRYVGERSDTLESFRSKVERTD